MSKGKPLARTEIKVRYHECDPSGIVFHPHYLAWADMACFDSLNTALGPYSDLTERGLGVVVADSGVRYLSPCSFEDELTVSSFLDHVGTTSMQFRFELYRNDSLVTEITNRYVWVGTETNRPIAPPEDVRDALIAYLPAT